MSATVEHIPIDTAAVMTILQEHNRLAEIIMATVDLAIDLDSGDLERGRLKAGNLRKATARSLRKSLVNTEGALCALVPEYADVVADREPDADGA